ncbi:MAG TPA: CPBP family glutamic-type intramembrane protease [Gemmataceae bacterium]|nr:CPBP family glutamic-type intramembrane protease [Gemmataceae bacterium]
MPLRRVGYWTSTRHPWPCLLFLLPLLAAYEGGVLWLGGTQPEALRNGADTWLHWGLEVFGLSQLYWPPVLIVLIFLFWSWLRSWDRPKDLFNVFWGMGFESLIYAGGLVILSRALRPFLDHFGIILATPPKNDPTLANLITFVGAGIYEEVLFRLIIFTLMVFFLLWIDTPGLMAFLAGAVGSACLFSGAHHAGPHGEAFDSYVFLFRTVAGLYFTLVYHFRGFGIAVGSHVCYDIIVGIILE